MLQLISDTIPPRSVEEHEGIVKAIAVFPRRIGTASNDKILHIWDLKAGVMLKKMGRRVNCVRYSPSGELLAISTDDNHNPSTREERVSSFKARTEYNSSFLWSMWLLSAGNEDVPFGQPWNIYTIAICSVSTFVAI